MFRVSHRRCPQLPVNGSLNQHMAKQVSLPQTPVRPWLPGPANHTQPHTNMALEGATWNPEGHQTSLNPRFLLYTIGSVIHTNVYTKKIQSMLNYGKQNSSCVRSIPFLPFYSYSFYSSEIHFQRSYHTLTNSVF